MERVSVSLDELSRFNNLDSVLYEVRFVVNTNYTRRLRADGYFETGIIAFEEKKGCHYNINLISQKLGLSKAAILRIINKGENSFFTREIFEVNLDQLKLIVKAYENVITKTFLKKKKEFAAQNSLQIATSGLSFRPFIKNSEKLTDSELFECELDSNLIENWVLRVVTHQEVQNKFILREVNRFLEQSIKQTLVSQLGSCLGMMFWIRSHQYYIFTGDEDASDNPKIKLGFSEYSISWIGEASEVQTSNLFYHEINSRTYIQNSKMQLIIN